MKPINIALTVIIVIGFGLATFFWIDSNRDLRQENRELKNKNKELNDKNSSLEKSVSELTFNVQKRDAKISEDSIYYANLKTKIKTKIIKINANYRNIDDFTFDEHLRFLTDFSEADSLR